MKLYFEQVFLKFLCISSLKLYHTPIKIFYKILFGFENIINYMQAQKSSLLESLQEEWNCPILHIPIQNPAITQEGNTYEREAIQQWLKLNKTDPITKKQLICRKPGTNIILKNVINKIYAGLPQLQNKLIEKEEIISTLMEEIQDLKADLDFERRKNELNDNLIEQTNESIKKIKIIEKERDNRHQKNKLIEKRKEVIQLQSLVNDLRTKQVVLMKRVKQQQVKIKDLQQSNSLLKRTNKEMYEKLQKDYNYKRCLKSSLDLTKNILNYKIKNEVRHLDFLIKSFKSNSQQISQQLQNPQFTEGDFDKIIYKGLDSIGQESERLLNKNDMFDYRYSEFINNVNIDRYLAKNLSENQQLLYHLEYIRKDYNPRQLKLIAYFLEKIPFSDSPTQLELSIDWMGLIKVTDKGTTDTRWMNFINNINQFPNLREVSLQNCNLTQLTQNDLTKIRKLKHLKFDDECVLSEQSLTQLRNYQLAHPNVNITIKQNFLEAQNQNPLMEVQNEDQDSDYNPDELNDFFNIDDD